MFSNKKIIYIIMYSFLTIVTPTPSVQAGWVTKFIQAENSEDFAKLKKHCLNMLARKDMSVKVERRWNKRFKELEERLKEKQFLLKKCDDEKQNCHLPIKKSSRQIIGDQKDPLLEKVLKSTSFLETLKFQFSLNDNYLTNDLFPRKLEGMSCETLKLLHLKCLKMLEYEDLLLSKRIWSKRLCVIEHLIEENRLESSRLFEQRPLMRASTGDDSYKIRYIFVNTKNPRILDLHGIASVHLAREKVFEFIEAAKSRCKSRVLIITGKGNHSRIKRRKGILFKSLPRWIEGNSSVAGYEIGRGSGSYIVSIVPSSKEDYRKNDFEQLRYPEYEITWLKKNGRSYLPCKQLYDEMIKKEWQTRPLVSYKCIPDEENISDTEDEDIFLSEIEKEEVEESIIEVKQAENNSLRLRKMCLIDFLTKEQKIVLKL